MIKIDTVEQFKVLQFIESNFDMHFITIKIVCKNALQVTDQNNDGLIFEWDSKQNKVVWKEGE